MRLPSHNPEASDAEQPSASGATNAETAGAVQPILDVLRRGRRFLVCSHVRPDGDALGSTLAVGMMLQQMGKQADVVVADNVPAHYRRLPGAGAIRSVQHVTGEYDAVILLECDGLERAGLSGLEAYFVINIDHHLSGHPYANLNWIDIKAASVGEMVYRLAKAAGATITPDMATCLYTTLLTDTGGFSYGSVQASTFEHARELVVAGADPVRIAEEVLFSTSMSKTLLLGAALNNLHRDGRVAWLWVTNEDMVRTSAVDEDAEGIVSFAIGIAGVDAAVFMRELPGGAVRMSLRSKGKLNVAAIAERLGGGGHNNAAGFTMDGPLARAMDEILGILRGAVGNLPTRKA